MDIPVYLHGPPDAWQRNSEISDLRCTGSVLVKNLLTRASLAARLMKSSTTALMASIPPSRSKSGFLPASVAAPVPVEVFSPPPIVAQPSSTASNTVPAQLPIFVMVIFLPSERPPRAAGAELYRLGRISDGTIAQDAGSLLALAGVDLAGWSAGGLPRGGDGRGRGGSSSRGGARPGGRGPELSVLPHPHRRLRRCVGELRRLRRRRRAGRRGAGRPVERRGRPPGHPGRPSPGPHGGRSAAE